MAPFVLPISENGSQWIKAAGRVVLTGVGHAEYVADAPRLPSIDPRGVEFWRRTNESVGERCDLGDPD